jgi:hypothetical protein
VNESFEKIIIGLAELMIADSDCGAIHRGNWRFPCRQCVEKERNIIALLHQTINDESVRRHVAAGHDERDGNKPKKLWGISSETDNNLKDDSPHT